MLKTRKRVLRVIAAVLMMVMALSSCGTEESGGGSLKIGDKIANEKELYYYYVYTLNANGIDLSTEEGIAKLAEKPADSEFETLNDMIKDYAAQEVQRVETFIREAEKEGITVPSEKGKADTDENFAELETTAAEFDESVEEYIQGVWGEDFTIDDLRYVMERMFTAKDYYETTFTDKIMPSEDEVKAMYDSEPEYYDKVKYRAFAFAYDSTDTDLNAEIKANASEMLDKITDEESFLRLSKEYGEKYVETGEKNVYEDPEATMYNYIKYEALNSAFASWLFDPGRKAGDKTLIETTDATYVMFYLERFKPEEVLVNIREMKLTVNYTNASTDAEKEAAKKNTQTKAAEIRNAINAAEKPEDEFINQIKKNSTDSVTIETEGLLAETYYGEQEDAVNEWAYDTARKEGDTAVIEVEDGYAIVYFISRFDEAEWYYFAKADALDKNYSKFMEENAPEYTFIK